LNQKRPGICKDGNEDLFSQQFWEKSLFIGDISSRGVNTSPVATPKRQAPLPHLVQAQVGKTRHFYVMRHFGFQVEDVAAIEAAAERKAVPNSAAGVGEGLITDAEGYRVDPSVEGWPVLPGLKHQIWSANRVCRLSLLPHILLWGTARRWEPSCHQ
jgi:hypothetical protein